MATKHGIEFAADFDETQLPDDEILELDARKQRESAREREKDALRRAKLHSFRFKGGML